MGSNSSKPLSAKPVSVQVGPYLYGVAYDERRINRLGVHYNEELFGHTDHMEQQIIVHPNLRPDMKVETLLHEILHCCIHTAGMDLDKEKGEDLEETIVRGLSPILLDTLRRNPHLVEYLVGVNDEESD